MMACFLSLSIYVTALHFSVVVKFTFPNQNPTSFPTLIAKKRKKRIEHYFQEIFLFQLERLSNWLLLSNWLVNQVDFSNRWMMMNVLLHDGGNC